MLKKTAIALLYIIGMIGGILCAASIAIAPFSIGCKSGPSVSAVTSAAIDCAEPVIAGQMAAIEANVAAALNGSPENWQGALALLEAQGIPAVVCAVQRIVDSSPPAPDAGHSSLNAMDISVQRGKNYLKGAAIHARQKPHAENCPGGQCDQKDSRGRADVPSKDSYAPLPNRAT